MEETGPVTYHTASPDVYFQAISKIENRCVTCFYMQVCPIWILYHNFIALHAI